MTRNFPPGVPIRDLDAPVRTAVGQLLLQKFRPESVKQQPVASDDIGVLNADAASKFLQSFGTAGQGGNGENFSNSVVTLNSAASAKLMEVGVMDEDDPNREKLVLSEIDKFRLRQAQRDK
jgi:hypothetical protein